VGIIHGSIEKLNETVLIARVGHVIPVDGANQKAVAQPGKDHVSPGSNKVLESFIPLTTFSPSIVGERYARLTFLNFDKLHHNVCQLVADFG
jgi:hypothetical protein